MNLVTPTGEVINTEPRKIIIEEKVIDDKRIWGVQFHPSLAMFDTDREVYQVLANVITSLCGQLRGSVREGQLKEQIAAKMAELSKQETSK